VIVKIINLTRLDYFLHIIVPESLSAPVKSGMYCIVHQLEICAAKPDGIRCAREGMKVSGHTRGGSEGANRYERDRITRFRWAASGIVKKSFSMRRTLMVFKAFSCLLDLYFKFEFRRGVAFIALFLFLYPFSRLLAC
jgi:hypothetical protein